MPRRDAHVGDQPFARRPRSSSAMPPSRARAAKQTRIADSDSGDDTEPDATPRPNHRTLSKKRISDVHDSSFTMDNGRGAQKSINVNDDAAEKRRRRKSARVVPLPDDEAGPSGEGTQQDDVRAAAHAKQKQQLLSIAQQPEINVPLDVMNSNFEEWMKMATDNVCLSPTTLCTYMLNVPLCRKLMLPIHGTLHLSTISMICLSSVMATIIRSTSNVLLALSMVA